jgi:NAD(P)-dependent dehydrogenase (short-subunit alcohol dehydrogenase family)
MARIFVTGSTDGLGRAAARSLLDGGHEVILHARSTERASTLADLASQAAGVAIGDLRSAAEVHRVAEQVNSIGRMNAVIHNAGIYRAPSRGSTPEGHADILAVNTLAPFMLTALIRPARPVGLPQQRSSPWWREFLTRSRVDPTPLESGSRLCRKQAARCCARFFRCAALAGGPQQRGRSWLGTHPDGRCKRSGRHPHGTAHTELAGRQYGPRSHGHRPLLASHEPERPAGEAMDAAFQDKMVARLQELTGVTLP